MVGCGQWGHCILMDLVSIGAEVIVADSSQLNRERAAASGAAAAVEGVRDIPAVDAVVVATPTSTHASVIEELLTRGVPIFSEKPLTADPESAERLAAQARDRLFVMDKWRYHPGVEMLGEIARAGELGPVIGLRTTRVGWGHQHADVDGIWTLAPHDLSIALQVMGTIPVPIGAVAEQVGGVPTGLTALLGKSPWLSIEVSVRSPQRRREISLHCRDGIAVLNDAERDRVLVTRNGNMSGGVPPSPEIRRISTELPLRRELRAYLDYLAGGPPPVSSAAEGVAIVKALKELRVLSGLDPVD